MQETLKNRTKKIGIEIIKLLNEMPNSISARAISSQIIRSATSIGANYRAACRAKSTADFINKLKIIEEETDETIYWLEVIEEAQLMNNSNIGILKKKLMKYLQLSLIQLKR